MFQDYDKLLVDRRSNAVASGSMPPQPKAETAKSNADDRSNEEHGSSNQRFELDDLRRQDICDEPSPIGLRLTMSPSLLNLVQTRLEDQANAAANITSTGKSATGKKRKAMSTTGNSATDKTKASNFPAKKLTIGDWSFTSTYEGNLVAKIYFAKHKLVWEVLDGDSLKNKIEIAWSDISAIKATCPEDGLGTLDVVLARRPFFFRETDPQPRKHTIWQTTKDFTGGQASIHRRHFLECPSDVLSKNFKKLIQHDPQLNMLSQQPAIILDSPAELQRLIFEDPVQPQICNAPNIPNNVYAPTAVFANPQFVSTSSKFPTASGLGRAPEFVSQAINLPRSGPLLVSTTNTQTFDRNAFSDMRYSSNPNFFGQDKVHRLQGSARTDDFANQMNYRISEQMGSYDPSSNNETLDYLSRCLLDDTQDAEMASDEKFVMTRVDSLRCLIQQDSASTSETANSDGTSMANNSYGTNEVPDSSSEATDDRQPAGNFREEESRGELLTQIPRAASMPQIFREISEGSENQAT